VVGFGYGVGSWRWRTSRGGIASRNPFGNSGGEISIIRCGSTLAVWILNLLAEALETAPLLAMAAALGLVLLRR